jgi:glycosyltransferase involved in cell wall biosynthesis
LPTVLLEALSLGKPVVATSIGGIPLVVKAGVNGILCPSGDIEALAEAIAGLIAEDSLRIRLGKAARASVQERFNWTDVAVRFAALFTSVVE